MSDNLEPSRFDKILSSITLIRIISVLGIITLFPSLKIPWQYTVAIFQGFFPFLIASFVMQLVLKSKLLGFRKEFWPLYNKYVSSLPFEFLGVFVFVMYSFKPNTGAIDWDEVKFASISFGGGIILEMLHRYVYPRLPKGKEIKSAKDIGVKEILSIISLVVLIFFLGFYTVLVNEQHVSQNLTSIIKLSN